jgi:Ca2+-binding RTX toxin-like protein
MPTYNTSTGSIGNLAWISALPTSLSTVAAGASATSATLLNTDGSQTVVSGALTYTSGNLTGGRIDYFTRISGSGVTEEFGGPADSLNLDVSALLTQADVASSANYLFATDDKLYGGVAAELFYGAAGADTIYGGDGADYIDGGIGNDLITGDGGNDVLIGADGNDNVFGGTGEDFLYGGAGTNTLYGDAGNDNITGGIGADLVYGGVGNEFVYGGEGVDTLYGDGGTDLLYGGLNERRHALRRRRHRLSLRRRTGTRCFRRGPSVPGRPWLRCPVRRSWSRLSFWQQRK